MMRVVQPLAAVQPSSPLASLVGGVEQGMQFAQERSAKQQLMEQQKKASDLAAQKQQLAQLQAQQAMQLAQSAEQRAQALSPLQQELMKQQAAEAKTRALMTPEEVLKRTLAQQNLKNQATLAAAANREKAQTQDEKDRANRMDKLLSTANNEGIAAAQQIPFLTEMKKTVSQMALPGPWRGAFNWASPTGQKLQAMLSQEALDQMQKIHGIRWTEFEMKQLQKSQGNPMQYASVLNEILDRKTRKQHRLLQRQSFFHHYVANGGVSPEELTENWIKQQPFLDQVSPHTAQNSGVSRRTTGAQVEDPLGIR